jgi:hypothetical protein
VRTALSLRSSSGANTESWINLINDSAKIQHHLATKSAATPYREIGSDAISQTEMQRSGPEFPGMRFLGVHRPPVLLFLATVGCQLYPPQKSCLFGHVGELTAVAISGDHQYAISWALDRCSGWSYLLIVDG